MRKGCRAHIRRKVVVRDDAVMASTTWHRQRGLNSKRGPRSFRPLLLCLQKICYCQGVTRRCRLSWLTNSALVYESKCGGMGGGGEGGCVASANEYSCARHVTWSPNKLFRDLSPFLTLGYCTKSASNAWTASLMEASNLSRAGGTTVQHSWALAD
jgi:hypothetical protein